MQYRSFGRLNYQPSALGFGCMRFPRLPDRSFDQSVVDETLRYAIDHGVNYLDTAYVYHGSEVAVGRALRGGYRERVKIATKLPAWEVKDWAEADRVLAEQLERLETGHIDFYLLHALNEPVWRKMQDLRILDWAERQLAAGTIGHLGFSYHGGLDALRRIIDAYPDWALCQLQYNYIDVEHETGRNGVLYAHERGLAVVIMEPLRGGLLATPPNAEIQAMFDAYPSERTPAQWALEWLWDQPEISLVLSGMARLSDVVDNVAAAARSRIGALTSQDQAFVGRVAAAIRSKMTIPCTACGYCLPCPEGLVIPEFFSYYNSACTSLPDRTRLNRLAEALGRWPEESHPDKCTACGACSARCPQGIVIHETLDQIFADLGVSRVRLPS